MNKENQQDPEPNPSGFNGLFAKIFGRKKENKQSVLLALRSAQKKDIVEEDALSIIEGALQVSDMQVREVMIPRTQMTFLKQSSETKELLEKIIESGHSRFPVIGENPDEVIGILLAKDMLHLALNNNDRFNIKDKMRQATFIPESIRLNVLLKDFRKKRNHMAIVINEYGGISGLVTIEDVLEQIVGEITDEHDIEDSALIKAIDENEFVVKSLTPVEEFNDYFDTKFSDDEFETIGGIILKQFGRLPSRDESVDIGNLSFKILNADNRKIKLLQVSHIQESESSEEFAKEA